MRKAPVLRGSPGMWLVRRAIIPVIRQHTPANSIAAPAVRDASYSRPVITPRAYGRFHRLATGLTHSKQMGPGRRGGLRPGRRGYDRAVKHAVDLSAVGAWGSPATLAELAALAEASGWDGVFLEDYVVYADGLDAYDPWVALAAIATATERIRIGTLVTPLPRRRPWKVAAEAMTLDHLSDGRMSLGVGSGDPTAADMVPAGEQPDARIRGEMLDEALTVIDALWQGEPVHHLGDHYQLESVALRPRPVQRPRIPVWVGGRYARRRPRER